ATAPLRPIQTIIGARGKSGMMGTPATSTIAAPQPGTSAAQRAVLIGAVASDNWVRFQKVISFTIMEEALIARSSVPVVPEIAISSTAFLLRRLCSPLLLHPAPHAKRCAAGARVRVLRRALLPL